MVRKAESGFSDIKASPGPPAGRGFFVGSLPSQYREYMTARFVVRHQVVAKGRRPVDRLALFGAKGRIGVENTETELGWIAAGLTVLQRGKDAGAGAGIQCLLGGEALLL